jgi:glycosyltransferase involved in cell wall biosynthesis
MRILTISYEYPPLGGGGAKVVSGLIQELTNSGHQIDLVTMWFPGLPLVERNTNFRIIRIPCIRFRKDVCRIWEMPLYIICATPVVLWLSFRNKYELNHTHFILPDGVLSFLAKFVTKLPYVLTAHGSDVPGYNPDRFKFAHRMLSPIWKRIARSAFKVVCPSGALEAMILRQESSARTMIIPNGLDLEKFCPAEHKQKRILVVTRMFERKGVQYLLDALKGFEHDFEVHIVGDGPYLPVLKGLVDQKNLDVNFWGFLDNQSDAIRELYETSRIFIFPSEAENFPIVLLEAMAAGMAIITTKNTGCAEVVGDAALLVKPRDSIGIRSALEQLTANPDLVKNLGTSARQRLRERFGWSMVAERYVSLYEESIID